MMPPGFPAPPADWKHEWQTVPSHDGKLQLFIQSYTSPQRANRPRTLIVLHGMGEHGGRYLHVPHFLSGVVDRVVLLDHRGHGKSEGLRGHVDRFDDLADDVAMLVRKQAERSTETHLVGHSLGGHIALRTLFLHPGLPLSSATASAPFLGIKQHVPGWKKAAGRVMAGLWGELQLDTGLDVDSVSRDPAVAKTYLSDRLTHTKMTSQFFVEMSQAMKDTLSRHDGITIPLQLLVPLDDRIVDAALSLKFYQALKHPDKRLREYEGGYHEPMHDIDKERVFADIASWVASHGEKGIA